MARKQFILDLGKLVIGAAWIDGSLTHEEINALKELLFLLPEISGEDWTTLELYMTHPVDEQERQHLLERVLTGIRTEKEKTLALETLEKLLAGDGKGETEEVSYFNIIRQDIESTHTGLFSHLTGPVRHALRKRAAHYQGNSSREDRLEDFIKNAIYFQLLGELKARGKTLQLSDSEIKKVCLAAGLMARIAWVDRDFCNQEKALTSKLFEESWGIPKEEAALLTEISHARILQGLDLVRLTTGFCQCTSPNERKTFLSILFAIANAGGKTSHAEIEEIRSIAYALQLSHQDFINAKLTISREDRSGL